MDTDISLDLVPTIQQAITNLLLTYEPEFLRFGYRLFVSFAGGKPSLPGARVSVA